jgi:hypothetical protein
MNAKLDEKLGAAVDAKVDQKLVDIGIPVEPSASTLVPMPALKESPTSMVVGGLMGIALCWVAWNVAGPYVGSFLMLLLAYEAWTLINHYPNDTISEIVWGLAERPMVPFLFGAGYSWAITAAVITNPWFIAAVGFLMGHFFFQRANDGV